MTATDLSLPPKILAHRAQSKLPANDKQWMGVRFRIFFLTFIFQKQCLRKGPGVPNPQPWSNSNALETVLSLGHQLEEWADVPDTFWRLPQQQDAWMPGWRMKEEGSGAFPSELTQKLSHGCTQCKFHLFFFLHPKHKGLGVL